MVALKLKSIKVTSLITAAVNRTLVNVVGKVGSANVGRTNCEQSPVVLAGTLVSERLGDFLGADSAREDVVMGLLFHCTY